MLRFRQNFFEPLIGHGSTGGNNNINNNNNISSSFIMERNNCIKMELDHFLDQNNNVEMDDHWPFSLDRYYLYNDERLFFPGKLQPLL